MLRSKAPIRRTRRVARALGAFALTLTLTASNCYDTLLILDLADLDEDSLRTVLSGLPTEVCALWLRLMDPDVDILQSNLARQRCEDLQLDFRTGLAPRVQAASGDAAGNMVMDTFQIDGKVAANKLPKWTAIFPSIPGKAGDREVAASVGAQDPDGNPSTSLPKTIQARLYDVNAAGNRKAVGKKTGKFNKETGGAEVSFGVVGAPRDHYEVEVTVKGGKLADGDVLISASERVEGVGIARGVAFSRWSPAPETRAGVSRIATWSFASVVADGNVSAKKLPTRTIPVYVDDLVPGQRANAFDVIAMSMSTDADLAPPRKQVKKVTYTLYDVNAAGKRTKLATQTGKSFKKPGMSRVTFEGVGAPSDHFEVDARAVGGKISDSAVTYSAWGGTSDGLRARLRRMGVESLFYPPLRTLPDRVEPERQH